MKNIDALLISADCSLYEAIRRLEETSHGILFLVNEAGCLIRAVTDGDVRRLFLQGGSLNTPLHTLPSKAPIFIFETDPDLRETALELMETHVVDQIPILNANKQPVGFIHRRDLSSMIFLSSPHLGEEEYRYVAEAFSSNWIAPLGPNVDAFEKELAEYLGVPDAAAVSSGTAALHLAMILSNVGPGDTVFCSSLTFVASANPILYQHAIPVFIDAEPESWNMCPRALEKALDAAKREGKLPKAVCIVNLYGQSADYAMLQEITSAYGVPIIEDAAESLGASYRGKPSGTLGDIGIFSFNGNKIITTSGGGMLISKNPEHVKQARFLATQAREATPYYEHRTVGYNYRMSNVLAGIGRGQLGVLGERVAARQAVYQRYQKRFADIPAIRMMPELAGSVSTHWLSAMLIDPKKSAVTPRRLIEALAKHHVEARHLWKPMHLQPLYEGKTFFTACEKRSVAEDLFETGVCLPSGSNLSVAQQERVIELVRGLF